MAGWRLVSLANVSVSCRNERDTSSVVADAGICVCVRTNVCVSVGVRARARAGVRTCACPCVCPCARARAYVRRNEPRSAPKFRSSLKKVEMTTLGSDVDGAGSFGRGDGIAWCGAYVV